MKIISSFLFLILLFSVPSAIGAQENRLQIVASHSILADVVSQVAGDLADVRVTMPPGTDPHGFQPVPGDLVVLAEADVVFINGAFFEEGLLDAIENAGNDMQIVTVSACVEMISFVHDEDDHDESHQETEVSGDVTERCVQHYEELDYSAPDFETMGMLHTLDCDAGCDPHVWMLPENVMLWTLLIRDTLLELDPAHAEAYSANAEAYLNELDLLVDEFIEPMIDSIPPENRLLVTSHDSLGYFAMQYGFEIVSTVIPGGSTLAEPSVAEMVETIEQIREAGVSAIFAESTLNDTIIRQISAETGADIHILYSGSLSDSADAGTYLDYMHYNVTTIVNALNGNH